MQVEEEEEFIIVDMKELSRTNFGHAVVSASLDLTPSANKLTIDSGVIQASFKLTKNDPVGTFVLYDESSEPISHTRAVYVIDPKSCASQFSSD